MEERHGDLVCGGTKTVHFVRVPVSYRPGRPPNELPPGEPDDAGTCGWGVAMPLGWSGNSGAGVRRSGGVGVPNGVTVPDMEP